MPRTFCGIVGRRLPTQLVSCQSDRPWQVDLIFTLHHLTLANAPGIAHRLAAAGSIMPVLAIATIFFKR